MRIPVQHSRTEPSMQLNMHLEKLRGIAAICKVLHQNNLFNQARDAHDQLVDQYNSQLPVEKTGFWKEFRDNLTFNMNTHTIVRLEHLENDESYQRDLRSYSNYDKENLMALLQAYLNPMGF